MTLATELLARFEAHNCHATLLADGHIHLDGNPPTRALELAAKHEPALRGELAHRAFLAGGEPSAWCNRCGRDVAQFTDDGTAWCDLCLVAHAARLVTTEFESAEVVEEVTPATNEETDPQLTLTQEKD